MKFFGASIIVLALLPSAFAKLRAPDPEAIEKPIPHRMIGDGSSNVDHFPPGTNVIGGQDAHPGEYPFFTDWSGCGASLIRPDLLLTAAHCWEVATNDVYIGAYYQGSPATDAEHRTIINRRSHPDYDNWMNPDDLGNDVMVLKINEPSTKAPIALASTLPVPGDGLTVIGHGVTSTGAPAAVLQEAVIPYHIDDTCDSFFLGYYGQDVYQEDNMLCAGDQPSDPDYDGGCFGDSGGPLLKQAGSGFEQVGIVSWGTIDCSGYGVFSEVPQLKAWIDQVSCELSDYHDGCPPIPDSHSTFRLDITYDHFASETGWSIKSADNTVIVDHPELSLYYQSGHAAQEHFHVAPGDYIFTMTDSNADGTCCGSGTGSVHITAELRTGDVLLVEATGEFASTMTLPFTVPEDPVPDDQDIVDDPEGWIFSEFPFDLLEGWQEWFGP